MPDFKALLTAAATAEQAKENYRKTIDTLIEMQDLYLEKALPDLLDALNKLTYISGRNYKGEERSYMVKPRSRRFWREPDGLIRFQVSGRANDVMLIIDGIMDLDYARRRVRPAPSLAMMRLHVTLEELMEQINGS